ncbi:hypothetical protein P7K49_013383, partial [Saguinus oedipus]
SPSTLQAMSKPRLPREMAGSPHNIPEQSDIHVSKMVLPRSFHVSWPKKRTRRQGFQL